MFGLGFCTECGKIYRKSTGNEGMCKKCFKSYQDTIKRHEEELLEINRKINEHKKNTPPIIEFVCTPPPVQEVVIENNMEEDFPRTSTIVFDHESHSNFGRLVEQNKDEFFNGGDSGGAGGDRQFRESDPISNMNHVSSCMTHMTSEEYERASEQEENVSENRSCHSSCETTEKEDHQEETIHDSESIETDSGSCGGSEED